jgi:hypothetical protein
MTRTIYWRLFPHNHLLSKGGQRTVVKLQINWIEVISGRIKRFLLSYLFSYAFPFLRLGWKNKLSPLEASLAPETLQVNVHPTVGLFVAYFNLLTVIVVGLP